MLNGVEGVGAVLEVVGGFVVAVTDVEELLAGLRAVAGVDRVVEVAGAVVGTRVVVVLLGPAVLVAG